MIEDGIPEAGEAIGKRLAVYEAHEGPDGKTRPGLVRLFAPQRDVEAEADQQKRGRDREDGNAAQTDAFSGGASSGETGGRKRGKTASAKASAAEPPVADAEYEVIPESRRVGATSTITIESAIKILAQIARVLAAGPQHLDPDDYGKVGAAIVAVLPAMNPDVDPEYVRAHVMDELQGADDNAHGLAHYVNRMVDQIRDLRDNPPPDKGAPAPTDLDADQSATLLAAAESTLTGSQLAEATGPTSGGNESGGPSFETPPAAPGQENAPGQPTTGTSKGKASGKRGAKKRR